LVAANVSAGKIDGETLGYCKARNYFSVMAAGNPSNPTKASSIYEFSANDIDGNLVTLDKYKGHVCIIVNVASK